MFFYYSDLKSDFTQKKLCEQILLYIMNTIQYKKSTGNFLLLQKSTKLGHIDHKIWGYFRQGKCIYK